MTIEASACTACHSRSRVIETRMRCDIITRRRECVRCSTRWNTVEIRQADYAALCGLAAQTVEAQT
jgi:transcriptional regulator NrdR family protein